MVLEHHRRTLFQHQHQAQVYPCRGLRYLCHVFLHDRFTRWEQLASFIGLAGVVLMARPISLFAATAAAAKDPTAIAGAVSVVGPVAEGEEASPVAATTTTELTPAERLIAIMAALIGALGGARVRSPHPHCA
ncbi:hypothetical protein PG994_013499 [Apiospora phragmitis]|uniref:Uncharacterized protein n=1 Tax=Apiospora phragmitis TaxID=2905665 RepID=A0ABR1T8U4_9PEZI